MAMSWDERREARRARRVAMAERRRQFPAPMIAGRWGRAQAADMLLKLGVRSLPAEGMAERLIDGVRVYVAPLVESRRRKGQRVFQGLRVMAICACGRHIAVGRLHQHICKGGR